ncbi:hypothetical protein BV898_06446 [Hypsibius exemplaris]|uniref:Uncharacterized protein n=1 Tax=Hypsibius exemplaris TaxID=2072580 RepID=A0A1W0WW86_HYPEX|nr:hypothetical protein BV898_06446 [Hypsibius exemplaris]
MRRILCHAGRHCAPDDQEEDYEDMSDDDEVAAHVPASPEDIPIMSHLTDWLRSDLVMDSEVDLSIKWPNDILMSSNVKIGIGILPVMLPLMEKCEKVIDKNG